MSVLETGKRWGNINNTQGCCLYIPHGGLGNQSVAGSENRWSQSVGTGLKELDLRDSGLGTGNWASGSISIFSFFIFSVNWKTGIIELTCCGYNNTLITVNKLGSFIYLKNKKFLYNF